MTAQEIKIRIEGLKEQLVAKYIVKDDVPVLVAERIRQLYRLMNTDLPVDYLVYRPSGVAGRLALGDPFATAVLMDGIVLYESGGQQWPLSH